MHIFGTRVCTLHGHFLRGKFLKVNLLILRMNSHPKDESSHFSSGRGLATLRMEKEILPLKLGDLFRAGDNYQHHGQQLLKSPLLIEVQCPLHQP